MCHYKTPTFPLSLNSQLNGKKAKVIAVLFLKRVKLFFQASFPHHRAVLKQQANQQLTCAGYVGRWPNTSKVRAITMISVVCFAWTNRDYAANKSVVWVEIPRKYSLKLLNLADDCFLAEGKRKNQNKLQIKQRIWVRVAL